MRVIRQQKIGGVGAWALAVGGMIGGGIYTLAGVILGLAGAGAWLSLTLGCLIALATVRSYVGLSLEIRQEGMPLSYLVKRGHYRMAEILAWWLLLIYMLATAVYSFTFGQYITHALGWSHASVPWVIIGTLGLLVIVNLFGIRAPVKIQIGAVCIELSVLLWLAASGFLNWNPKALVSGVPVATPIGVISGMAATFIAFEGFEMLTYDLRDLERPRTVLTRSLPFAIIAVGLAYALVVVGAASLVGAGELVREKEHSLASVGQRVAGVTGLYVVAVTACASAASAINATLFSVVRLARSAAESRLLPPLFSVANRRGSPYWTAFLLGGGSAVIAIFSTLEILVQMASLGFLVLFAFINGLAWVESSYRSIVAGLGALGAVAAAGVVIRNLILVIPHGPKGLVLFGTVAVLSVAAHAVRQRSRRLSGDPPPERDPVVQDQRRAEMKELHENEQDRSRYRLK